MSFFSIIIPSYNRAASLVSIVSCLLKQSFSDFEIVIIDDGSTDDTAKRIASLMLDKRIAYYFQPNQGVSNARNNGALKARGSYLIFLDSDDNITDSWLSDFHDILWSLDKDIAFCGVQQQFSDGRNKFINPRDPYRNKKDWGVFLAGAFSISRDLFFSVGMYDPKIRFGENTELSYRIRQHKPQPAFVENANLIYKPSTGGGSKDLQNRINSNLYILEKHESWFRKRPKSKMYYLQAAGIACLKLNRPAEARKHLKAAWRLNPWNIKNALRLIFLNIPFIAKHIWKPQPVQHA